MATDPRSDQDTSLTLVMRIQKDPADPAAWDELVQHYRPMIEAWCQKWGLQASDCDDVTQEVLVKLLAAIGQFQYDPSRSFRSWLKTVTHHALTDFARARRRLESRVKGQVELLAEWQNAMADLERSLEGAFYGELLELAMRQVEKRVKPRNWQAFRLTTVEGLSGADAADRLQMPVAQLTWPRTGCKNSSRRRS
jgi:RNA polymerase sigma-70 factor (ECF subfamily)